MAPDLRRSVQTMADRRILEVLRAEAKWNAFLEMGFRPLYLAGACWAAVSIAIWIFAPDLASGRLSGPAWHAHEMLWGFVATIAAGFLMTAGATWTGINPLQGKMLAFACVLWALARLGFLIGPSPWFEVAVACELAFFGIAAFALGRAVYRSKNRRNYGVPWLVLGLGVADALYLHAVVQGNHSVVMQRFEAGLICMAVITLLVARRVIPFFAMKAVPGLQIPLHLRSGQLQMVTGVSAVAFTLLDWPMLQAAALSLTAAICGLQVKAWKPWAVRHQPLLWILYIGYLLLGVGLLLGALHAVGAVQRTAIYVHVLAIGGFSVLIIGMVTRTALGHLGRPLVLDRSMRITYYLVLAAFAFRVIALVPSSGSFLAVQLSAVAWIAAFAVYFWRFFPMMVRPRPPR